MVFNYLVQGFWQIVRYFPIAFLIALIFCFIKYKDFLKKETLMITFSLTYVIGVLNITGVFSDNPLDKKLFLNSISNISIPFINADLRMIVLNVLLFVPLGFLGCSFLKCKQKNFVAIMLNCFLSVFIEVIQGFKGRFLEVDDIIANTLGGIIGCFGYSLLKKSKIKFPKKDQIIIIILSVFIFISMSFVFDYFYVEVDNEIESCDYIYIFDQYDSDTSSIMDFYDEPDSLQRLEKCDIEMKQYFGDNLEIFSTQQLESCDNCEDYLNAIQIERDTYFYKNIDLLILEGEGIKNFEYTPNECPILLSENMRSEYKVGDTFEMCYLGDMVLKFKVCGFLDASKIIIFANNCYNTSDYVIMPLFEHITESDLDVLNKQIILTDRIESIISYTSEKEKTEILNKIKEMSKKYDLKLYTIDANIQKTNQTLRIPIFLLAFIVIILIMLYCIKIYHDVIKNKEILSITFWQIIIGYVWIMLKSGWYVSGNVIVSTVSSFLFMLICNFTVLCINAKIKKESIYS